MTIDELQTAREGLRGLLSRVAEVRPVETVRQLANRLVAAYPLGAADSLQLAAALIWAEQQTEGRHLVTLDERLRQVARQEGFLLRP